MGCGPWARFVASRSSVQSDPDQSSVRKREVPSSLELLVGTFKENASWSRCCFTCHRLGNSATRTIPQSLGTFKSFRDAWERRTQSGQAMTPPR